MINKINKNTQRQKRHLKVRKKVFGTASTPRLNVYRSSTNIYAQIINDETGLTLCSASTLTKDLKESLKGKVKTEQAFLVGEHLGKLAKKKGIKQVVFDRGGYLYTGRVLQLAEGSRKAGLEF
ncbi:MAG: 50S ribosomal protein L18 [Clostridia bacterium]|nr:50S ribosomal protein L18 [Clostridia bacterium]